MRRTVYVRTERAKSRSEQHERDDETMKGKSEASNYADIQEIPLLSSLILYYKIKMIPLLVLSNPV